MHDVTEDKEGQFFFRVAATEGDYKDFGYYTTMIYLPLNSGPKRRR